MVCIHICKQTHLYMSERKAGKQAGQSESPARHGPREKDTCYKPSNLSSIYSTHIKVEEEN